eukprot:1239563-Lingulodinium_polyedra.AAC.1
MGVHLFARHARARLCAVSLHARSPAPDRLRASLDLKSRRSGPAGHQPRARKNQTRSKHWS